MAHKYMGSIISFWFLSSTLEQIAASCLLTQQVWLQPEDVLKVIFNNEHQPVSLGSVTKKVKHRVWSVWRKLENGLCEHSIRAIIMWEIITRILWLEHQIDWVILRKTKLKLLFKILFPV